MPTITPHQDPTETTPVPHPIHPVAGRPIGDDTPTFDWTALPDATRYRVQLAPDEAFERLYYDQTGERPVTIDLGEVLSDEASTVYWRVRADGTEQWSEVAHFRAPGVKVSVEDAAVEAGEPVPVAPTEGAEVEAGASVFAWEDVPEASGYQLQVATTPDFVGPLVDLTLDRAPSVVLYDRLPEAEDRLHWRVRPLFPDGRTGPWNSPVSFVPTVGVESEGVEAYAPHEGAGEEDKAAPDRLAAAAGWALQGRTGRTTSIMFILLIVIGFFLTLGLISWVG